jgi:hypothetical protein
MSLDRHPDPAIAAWLADGPTELSSPTRSAISVTVRTTRQRRSALSWLPDPHRGRLLALVGVLTVVLTLAVAAGAARLVGPQPSVLPAPSGLTAPTAPAPSTSPAPTRSARVAPCWDADATVTVPSEGSVTLPGTAVSMDYSLPPILNLATSAGDGAVAFRAPFAFPPPVVGDGEQESVPASHGIAVVDVTRAVRHGSLILQPRLGTDAETFLRDLDIAIPYPYNGVDGVIDFEVDEVALTQLAGMPAWTARVSVPDLDPPMWSHIDNHEGAGRGCAVEFGMPNRIWVMDVGSSIVLVQVWASDDAELAAWLPDAIRLVDSFRFRSEPS